jgi:hypothetical protein
VWLKGSVIDISLSHAAFAITGNVIKFCNTIIDHPQNFAKSRFRFVCGKPIASTTTLYLDFIQILVNSIEG